LNIFNRFKQFSLRRSKLDDQAAVTDKPLPPDSPFDFDPDIQSGELKPDPTNSADINKPQQGATPPSVTKKNIGNKVVTAAAGAVGAIGSVAAKPFRGSKPFYKRPLFWLGLTTTAGAIGLGALWLVIDQSVSKYPMKEPLSFAREGTLTIKGSDGTNLLQLGSDTSETLSSFGNYPIG
jgi:hypothetical protein